MVKQTTRRYMPHRRRREQRTNYGKRVALVLSSVPRIVVRASNKHTFVQFIEARPQGDHVLASAKSVELEKLGWKYGCSNLPAAYLTGMLAGVRALERGTQKAILDTGVRSAGAGTRIFGAMKGALDAGVDIPHDDAVLPPDVRIKGEHIAEYAKQLSGDADRYKVQFSGYLSRKVKPEDLPSVFEKAKGKISSLSKSSQKEN